MPARAHNARQVLLALLLLLLLVLEVMVVLEVNASLARPQQRTHGELMQ